MSIFVLSLPIDGESIQSELFTLLLKLAEYGLLPTLIDCREPIADYAVADEQIWSHLV